MFSGANHDTKYLLDAFAGLHYSSEFHAYVEEFAYFCADIRNSILEGCMENKNKYLTIGIILAVALVAAIAVAIIQTTNLNEANSQLDEVSSIMEYERQQSINEYEELVRQYDEFYITVGNDSLLTLIEEEKSKVNSLLQELRTVKATNAKRIAELKQELGVVRSVLKSYIQKYDSLNEVNASLQTENKRVWSQYHQQNKVLEEKSQQIAELDKKITMAAILEAGDISINTLNKRGKKTSLLRRVETLEICFNILRNITAERGIKTVYVRVSDSKEHLIGKAEGTFDFEGGTVEYSAAKEIEYGGETLPVCLYIPVAELEKDTYSVAVFAEGNLIGNTSFTLK